MEDGRDQGEKGTETRHDVRFLNSNEQQTGAKMPQMKQQSKQIGLHKRRLGFFLSLDTLVLYASGRLLRRDGVG